MSTWALVAAQIKQWLDHELFFIRNKIQKPKEVLVIVARSSPPRHMLNKSSRVYR